VKGDAVDAAAAAAAKRSKVASSSAEKKPFSRLKEEDWQLVKPELSNMSFEAHYDEYGAAANEVLSKERGKGFRQQKQKKKNSYRGGAITDSVRSFKFSD
jgi:hypothetical protein